MKYVKYSEPVDAVRFDTNNEVGCQNMDEICIWANQGVNLNDPHLWHNGTDIFVVDRAQEDYAGNIQRASVGDYIVKNRSGVSGTRSFCEFHVYRKDEFEKNFTKVEL